MGVLNVKTKIIIVLVGVLLWALSIVGTICVCKYRANKGMEELRRDLATANQRVREKSMAHEQSIDGIGKTISEIGGTISDITDYQQRTNDSLGRAEQEAQRLRDSLNEVLEQ